MNHLYLKEAILKRLDKHRGRARAVPRAIVEDDLEPFVHDKDVDRAFRRAYAQLPICSCKDGLFIPETEQEVLDFERYMTLGPGGPIAARERVSVIYRERPDLRPDAAMQMELPL